MDGKIKNEKIKALGWTYKHSLPEYIKNELNIKVADTK